MVGKGLLTGQKSRRSPKPEGDQFSRLHRRIGWYKMKRSAEVRQCGEPTRSPSFFVFVCVRFPRVSPPRWLVRLGSISACLFGFIWTSWFPDASWPNLDPLFRFLLYLILFHLKFEILKDQDHICTEYMLHLELEIS